MEALVCFTNSLPVALPLVLVHFGGKLLNTKGLHNLGVEKTQMSHLSLVIVLIPLETSLSPAICLEKSVGSCILTVLGIFCHWCVLVPRSMSVLDGISEFYIGCAR